MYLRILILESTFEKALSDSLNGVALENFSLAPLVCLTPRDLYVKEILHNYSQVPNKHPSPLINFFIFFQPPGPY